MDIHPSLSEWLQNKSSQSYFRLKHAVEGSADIRKNTGKRPVFAGVSLRLEPANLNAGISKKFDLPNQDTEDFDQKTCIEAAFQGAIDALLLTHFHPVLDVNVVLTRFFYDKPQSARVAFWEAGRDAVFQALEHQSGVGLSQNQNLWELVSRG